MGRVGGFAQRFLAADREGKLTLSRWAVRRILVTARYSDVTRMLARNDEWVLVRPRRGRDCETYLVSARDRVISRYLILNGDYEFDLVLQALGVLQWKQVDVLVDVGANIGTVCLPALRRGYARRAVAVEPDPMNVTLLRANALMNGVTDRLEVHDVAATASPGEFELARDTKFNNFGDHRMVEPGLDVGGRAKVRVRGDTLDNLVGSFAEPRVLLWLDVQGYEGQVLAGSAKVLNAGAALVMEFSPAHLARHGGVEALQILQQYHSLVVDLRSGEVAKFTMAWLNDRARTLGDQFTDLLFVPAGHRLSS